MVFQQLTDQARMVVAEARAEAAESGGGAIGTEHILLGLLRVRAGVAGVLLAEFGVTLEAVRARAAPGPARAPGAGSASARRPAGTDLSAVREAIEACLGRGAPLDPGNPLAFTTQARDVLRHASEAASTLRHRYIGAEHLLLGVLRAEDSLARETLTGLSVDLAELARQTRLRVAPEQTRLEQSLKRFNDLAVQLRDRGSDETRLTAARTLRSTVMKEARNEEATAVAEAAVRFANRLDAASEQLAAALRAVER